RRTSWWRCPSRASSRLRRCSAWCDPPSRAPRGIFFHWPCSFLLSARRSADDVDPHREGSPLDGPHGCLEAARGHVRHLGLGDLLELLPGDFADLLLARLMGPGALLLIGVEACGLLEQNGRRRRLERQRE